MRRSALVALAVVAAGALSAPAVTAAPTTVTFGFDDNGDTQLVARDLLAAHGMRATFFVNSGTIGTPGFLSWAEVAALQAAGHEIGGHTVAHTNLVTANPSSRRAAVCADRQALLRRGLDVRNFAYPNGAFNDAAQATVADCGYNSARTTQGISPSDCDLCAEPLPLPDNRRYRTRALQILAGNTAQDLIDAIQKANQNSGGWLQIVLHDVCSAPSGSCGDPYEIGRNELGDVLTWLAGQPQAAGYRVATVQDVVGLPSGALPADYRDPPPPPPPPPSSGGGGGSPVTVPVTPLAAPEPPATDAPAAPPGAAASPVTPAASSVAGPRIRLVNPLSGARVGRRMTVLATATAPAGVARVRFLVDGRVVAVDRRAPYRVHVRMHSMRGRRIAVKAEIVDAAGSVARTATHVVRVLRTAR
jgi:peptidoglycan/xylan/chitin deacetylase (PgdA/CDA1 family)